MFFGNRSKKSRRKLNGAGQGIFDIDFSARVSKSGHKVGRSGYLRLSALV